MTSAMCSYNQFVQTFYCSSSHTLTNMLRESRRFWAMPRAIGMSRWLSRMQTLGSTTRLARISTRPTLLPVQCLGIAGLVTVERL